MEIYFQHNLQIILFEAVEVKKKKRMFTLSDDEEEFVNFINNMEEEDRESRKV